jgi:YbbR domain-containing protein
VVTATDVMPANEIPDRVAFRLAGPKAFLRAVVDRREDPIRVNLTGSKPNIVTYRFFSDNIRVPPGVKVLSISPTAILIKLEYVRHREVPVKVELRGLPPEGYRIVRTTVEPATIRLKGPESKVSAISEVFTTPIDVSNLTESKTVDVGLQIEKSNVQAEGPLPKVTVEVEPVSANFRIRNIDIRVLSPYQSVLDEKTATVLVRARAEDLKSLDRSQVDAVVDLRGKPKGRYTVPVKVTLPPKIGLVKVIPEKIRVLLK